MTNPPVPSTSAAAPHQTNARNNHNNNNNNHNSNQNQYNVLNQPLLDAESTQYVHDHEPLICLAPPPHSTIHRPMVNLVEFLSSYSICLNSYEDRIGVTIRGEKLSTERLNSLKEIIRSQSKRQRHDSVCPTAEKKSPDCKRIKTDPDKAETLSAAGLGVSPPPKSEIQCFVDDIEGISQIESSADESDCKDDVKPISFETQTPNQPPIITQLPSNVLASSEPSVPTHTTAVCNNKTTKSVPDKDKVAIAAENRAKRKESKSQAIKKRDHQRKENFRPLIDEEVIAKIMRGWSSGDVGDLTIGDLYIMFGHNFQVNLEYTWIRPSVPKRNEEWLGNEVPSAVVAESKPVAVEDAPRDSTLSNKLKQLLVLANMANSLKRKPNCACSHFGDKLYKNKVLNF